MDGSRFDSLTRRLASGQSRRTAAAIVGSLLTVPFLVQPSFARKKKKKKVTLCLAGQTIQASKKTKKKLLKVGATAGACSVPTIPPPSPPTTTTTPAPTCRDGVRNGSESDVDCGGPDCVRCVNTRRCDGPNDCASSYCVDNTCQACPVEFGACGPNGAPTCACARVGMSDQLVCIYSPIQSSGPCNGTACPADHVCVILGGAGPNPTCLKLCGA